MNLLSECFERFTDAIDDYMRQSRWTDLALIKWALLAMGAIVGLCLPKRAKMPALVVAAITAATTTAFIMVKFVPLLIEHYRGFLAEEDWD